ncbi:MULTISPECIES: class I SAM-dependent methyltransferase [unclassified Polynucleobacter]|uniref:class I SAM-dependent methyltransferase n=1 Tax=unclassified Polynucleobacter TaxID=2640945 RepID=UPI001F34491A|nr:MULTISPECIES: class I SAM-dependent methyltransferase [unclassified Polynucleobacter]MCE7527036.1 class I SAM-dependent methyltransferase [Polynucleobacter sp. IMCC 30228]MCE7529297.1 class I SAM-dependent methyltransferase [Polynucleobacter sp. IMCC 29146]
MISTPPPSAAHDAPPWSSWEQWLNSPPGQYVLAWEEKRFAAAVGDVFGFHALQIGLPQLDGLNANRMPLHVLSVSPGEVGIKAQSQEWHIVEGLPTELPFASQSIDLVLLPHVLEFAADPHQILREVDRILLPEGRVIISGFNPASIWGVRQYLSHLFGTPYLPRTGQFISLLRLKDWLKLLDYSVDRGHFGCYKFPLQSSAGMTRMDFLEPMGNRWWPIFGAVFLISAIKRTPGMHLLGRIPAKRLKALTQLTPAVEQHARLPGNE